jgi:hypothetical protein
VVPAACVTLSVWANRVNGKCFDKSAILTNSISMQQIWAITQCVDIDAGMSGTIIRAFRFHAEGERVKTWLYGLLSVLLLHTAAIVLNIESVQQTLNLTLNAAYLHVFVPVEVLIWIRSIAIVLLIVAHVMRHVQIAKPQGETAPTQEPQPPQLVITPELLDTLRGLLSQTTVTEEQAATPLLLTEESQETDYVERVKAYLAQHPKAPLREIAEALTISVTTANKWRTRIQGEGTKETVKKRKNSCFHAPAYSVVSHTYYPVFLWSKMNEVERLFL